jgi:cytochrome c2
MFFSQNPINQARYALVFGLAALIIASPTAETSAAQKSDRSKHPPILLNYSKMTTQQLADEGEKIIFGGRGLSNTQGAIGRGQCPWCHTTIEGMSEERAPNLFGVTKRASQRLRDPRYHLGKPLDRDTDQKEAFPGAGTATTPLEYIAESLLCPSCYIVLGYDAVGSEGRASLELMVTKPPVNLKIDDLVMVTTWLYVHDKQTPPSPSEIVKALKKFMTPKDWQRVTTIDPRKSKTFDDDTRFLASGEESVDVIFAKAQCVSCHIIPGIANYGTIGPALHMKVNAQNGLKDPMYKGTATTTREYIVESILYPSRYVPDGYPDNTMPMIYRSKLTALAIDKMVNYLAEVEEGTGPPPVK